MLKFLTDSTLQRSKQRHFRSHRASFAPGQDPAQQKRANTQRSTKTRQDWRDQAVRRAVLEQIGQRLGVQSPEDWYKTSLGQAQKADSRINRLIKEHQNTYVQALLDLFPEHAWDISKFELKPRKHWENPNNIRVLFDSAAQKLGVRAPEDWYLYTLSDVKKANPSIKNALEHKNLRNLCLVLNLVYSEHSWTEEKVRKTRILNLLAFAWLILPLRLNFQFERRKFSKEALAPGQKSQAEGRNLAPVRGPKLLDLYEWLRENSLSFKGTSISDQKTLLPTVKSLFGAQLSEIFKLQENRKIYLLWASAQLGIPTHSNEGGLEKWYSIKLKQFSKLVGAPSLLEQYETRSLYDALTEAFHDHKWEISFQYIY